MANYSRYLLYYDSQIEAFRKEHKKRILQDRDNFRAWFETLELERWYNYVRPGASEKEVAYTVGLFCILYLDGEINITFKQDTADQIKRSPKSEAEYQKYLENNTK